MEQCEQVSAHYGNRFQPLLWRFYASHRKALFCVLKVLAIHSTTADQALMNAVAFILEHEQSPKKYLEATIDLSFASRDWQRTVLVRRKRKDWFISYVAAELKTGDLCVRGSEQFADYRDQLFGKLGQEQAGFEVLAGRSARSVSSTTIGGGSSRTRSK